MKKRYACYFSVVILVFSLLFSGILLQPGVAKGQSAYQQVLQQAEQQYGISDVLIHNSLYFPPHYRAKGHPFYPGEKFREGRLYINGMQFSDVMLNYQAVQDEIIFTSKRFDKSVKLILNSHFTDSARLGSHLLVNARYLPVNPNKRRYYELVHQGKMVCFIGHRKSFMGHVREDTKDPGFYNTVESKRYLYKNGKLYSTNRRRAFIKAFDSHRREIRRFMRHNNIRYNRASVKALRKLLRYCEQLVQTQ